MRALTYRISYECGQRFTIVPLGDVHFGSAACATHEFDSVIARIRSDPDCYWIGMGDMVESIAPNDKRWTAGGVDEKVVNLASQDRIGDVYVAKMGDKLHPIAGKCLAYLRGNHERTFDKHYYTNLSVRIMDAAGIDADRYCPWAVVLRVAFETPYNMRTALRIFASHGWQAGRMDGAKVNEVARLMAYVDADIYLQGHSHARFVIPRTRITVNPSWTKVTDQKVYVAHTGSFLKTLEQSDDASTYAEEFGYPPTNLGVIRFHVTPGREGVAIEAVT